MTVYNYTIRSNHPLEMISIDTYIEKAIEREQIIDGICLIFCPHTTAGITLNENYDPNVKKDLVSAFSKISPKENTYLHLEGNSHAHFLSSLVGVSKEIIIKDGKAFLGDWQGLYFCEFDGPRQRKFHIKFIKA